MGDHPTTRILVVDDEPGIRTLLSYELGLRGYKVDTAANGQEAIQKAEQTGFRVVLCDINMPQLGGLEFLDAIRKQGSDAEVIMMTGYATIENAVAAMKNGAYDFIQKPFNLDEVLMLIEKCLEKTELKILMGVYEASQSVFQSVKLETVLPRIAQRTLEVMGADEVSIMLLENGQLLLKASAGGTVDPSLEPLLRVDPAIAGPGALGKEPMIISGSSEPGAHSSIVYPLVIEDQTLGVINIHRSKHADVFTQADLRIATIFSSQIAQAVYNAQLYQELELKVHELRNAKKKLEETQMQLIQSEKLAGIGQLAAGVAHELNNPLSGVMGFTQLLLEDTTLKPGHRKDLEIILNQSQRCRVIIQNLLQFSRRKDPKKEALNFGPLIQITLDLVKYDFSTSGIEITQKIPDTLPLIFGDPHQLQQVFLNLFTNARQAMQGQGRGKLMIEAGVEGKYVFVRIKDTGPGMAPDVMTKIFEPFFTTKPVGQGTGLGLSICHGIVQEHKGMLRVESEVHQGTTFILELPIYE